MEPAGLVFGATSSSWGRFVCCTVDQLLSVVVFRVSSWCSGCRLGKGREEDTIGAEGFGFSLPRLVMLFVASWDFGLGLGRGEIGVQTGVSSSHSSWARCTIRCFFTWVVGAGREKGHRDVVVIWGGESMAKWCVKATKNCSPIWKTNIAVWIPPPVETPQSMAPPRYAVVMRLAFFLGMLYAFACIQMNSRKKWAKLPKNTLGPPCVRWAFADADVAKKKRQRYVNLRQDPEASDQRITNSCVLWDMGLQSFPKIGITKVLGSVRYGFNKKKKLTFMREMTLIRKKKKKVYVRDGVDPLRKN